MARRIWIRQLPWRRTLGALLALLSLVAAITTLVVILRDPIQLLPWAALSGLIIAAGYGAHLTRRR
jgi:membrane associated rhomboid family serine protease